MVDCSSSTAGRYSKISTPRRVRTCESVKSTVAQ
ncbi:hypothetical protein T03_14471 [Trichinella britovi]|uniref:Uncharacterized protein n=1 Tax=Trichinella britovi TaxID=45882 RepID=A0A0V1A2M4_TRIBR|nr:hypothetical protein T03_14471 [Trichinella britovi]